jgi:hypothetical protein
VVEAEAEEDPVLVAANAKWLARQKEANEKQAAGIGDSVPGKLFEAFSDHYKKESTPGGGGHGAHLKDSMLAVQIALAWAFIPDRNSASAALAACWAAARGVMICLLIGLFSLA